MSSQVSALPRRGLNARQAETVERLMAAGLDELRAVGHEALTVRTVAQRAGVSPATAYTYLASKNHLFAELFWRFLAEDEHEPEGSGVVERVQSVTRHLARRLADAPELAAAVTPALLGRDPDVERLRLRIGAELVERFRAALGPDADPVVVETVALAFSGALLQGGMGLMTYTEMGERLDDVVAVIMRGHPT
ncbi:TetR/AcrR family transcriptional regulator [Nocardioides sp. YIM 152315]|uniref:TetR/AcrR family transcriptional regulator n=1 Tax=Nocardioides sp. YIM 152315 TaxID=3031760 RepID=UPI0023DA6718|nr:TetR/AcrR family transcriptional regulator [Nocardioides sp. YIM 152315]MDF1604134.1 TetR/AcrR family transcriptional regulator [Nocardioides sp. YIM 152315]